MVSIIRDNMESVWTKTAGLPGFPELEGDIGADVLIVGGGMAGVLCARELTNAGADCVLVEADRLGGGITKGTTAKITAQHGLIYDKLIRRYGERTAGLYLRANLEAGERYRELCRDIDCDYEPQDSYVYSLNDPEKLRRETEALRALGFEGSLETDLPLPFKTAGAVRFPGQAQFHPLKFLGAVARGLRIYEHTKVLELGPGKAVTNRGTIEAGKIIIATHFPVLNKHGGYFVKLYQQRSYVLALEGAPGPGGMYVDEAASGLSFRGYKGALILGGGSRRTGKPGGWKELEAFAGEHYPGAEITARWAAQDCMSLDGMPYIGRYSRGTEGLYTATGFNKWGMTSSMAAAALLRDLLTGRDNPYQELFDPSRSVFHKQLAVNVLESAVGLLTPTAPRCPHMGCALKYNAAEHSWDCPCHGSRFGEDGRLIDNPAADDRK